MLLSSFFTRSMVFAHIPKAQLLFALLSETFLTIRQNSLNVTVCMIARSSCRGYFIHSLSTLYYYNAPSLATRLTGDYRDRTFTGKCGPASLDTRHEKAAFLFFLVGSEKRRLCGALFCFFGYESCMTSPKSAVKEKMKYSKTAGSASIGSASSEKSKPISP